MLIKSQTSTVFQSMLKIIYEHNLPHTVKKYDKKQLICAAQTKCDKIGIILKGQVSIENILSNGKKVIINLVSDCFGEILLFTENSLYPYNVTSYGKSEVLFITKDILLKIFKVDTNILENYLEHLSSSYMLLNRYIKLKSQKTIRSKLAYYLVYYLMINSKNETYKITTKTELADFLGIERQSLIRELNKLKANMIIDYDRNSLTILNYNYIISLIE